LLDGTDANDFLHVLARPERDRGTPVSVSRDVPITSVLEPLTESTFSDVLWNPKDQLHLPSRQGIYVPSGLFVVGDELVAEMSYPDEPRRNSSVDERSSGSDNQFPDQSSADRLTSSRMGNYG